MTEFDVKLPTGDILHGYDTGGDGRVIVWHHGTPNVGAPPEPLFRPGVRWISYDRPAYGGSTRVPGRDVASAAMYTAALADHVGVQRFSVLGHSGGAPHALACAALLPDRVERAAGVSGLAPYGAAGLDWFAGMAPVGQAGLRAAVRGRAAKEAYEADPVQGDFGFNPDDDRALETDWAWVLDVVHPALAGGPDGAIDDDLAYVNPWGFDPAEITVPVLLVHGGADRMVPADHSRWTASVVPGAELRIVEGAGHITVLRAAPDAVTGLLG